MCAKSAKSSAAFPKLAQVKKLLRVETNEPLAAPPPNLDSRSPPVYL